MLHCSSVLQLMYMILLMQNRNQSDLVNGDETHPFVSVAVSLVYLKLIMRAEQ